MKIRNILANHRTQQSISCHISYIFATIQFEQVLLYQFLPSVVFEIIRKKFMSKGRQFYGLHSVMNARETILLGDQYVQYVYIALCLTPKEGAGGARGEAVHGKHWERKENPELQ